MKRLIAVMTCHRPSHLAKVQAIRETWAPALRQFADVVYFYGRNPQMPNELGETCDSVWLDVDDSYLGIPAKVRAICEWAHNRGYDYMSKVDDDVYIVPQRWTMLPVTPHDYVGRFRGPVGNYPAHFASGFCYHLSKRAMGIVASAPHNGDWMDERFVANALAYHKIFGHTDPISYAVTGPHISPRFIPQRHILRDAAVFCEYSAPQLREAHAELAGLRVISHPGVTPVARVTITSAQFTAPPIDAAPIGKVLAAR